MRVDVEVKPGGTIPTCNAVRPAHDDDIVERGSALGRKLNLINVTSLRQVGDMGRAVRLEWAISC